MDQKIVNIQAVRAVAALGVLASHLYAYDARYAADPVLPAWFTYGFSGVDLFFAVSGFVMVLVTRGRFGDAASAGAFLFSRVWRIYPPFWLFTAVVIAGFAAAGTLEARLEESTLIGSLTLFPVTTAAPLLQVGWTLTHELYFYLVFALMLLAPQRLLPVLLALWCAVILAAWSAGLGAASPPARIAFSPLTFEFVAGAAAGLLVVSGRRRFGWAAIAVGVAGIVAGSLWIGPPDPMSFASGWRRFAAFGIPCALIVYGAACVEVDGRSRAPDGAVALGDWSYSLYLLHLPLIAALAALWADRWAGPLDNLAFALIATAAAVALSWAAFRGFERPVLALGGKLRARLFPARRPQPGGTPRLASRIW